MAEKIRAADYIASALASAGVSEVFMVTGGGAMHLNDAFGKNRSMRVTCCHHEQACAIAAESYFRVTGSLAVCNVTTGPGGTNAITGVYGAWTDSLGMVVVSGNVKWETMIGSTELPLRQLGDQEVDIVAIVKPITKYAVCVNDLDRLRYHVERAIHLAKSGRPGPVWLDIPMNIQGAMVIPSSMKAFDSADEEVAWETADLDVAAQQFLDRLMVAERPVILAGSGVRISGAHDDFIRLVDRLKIPVTSGWNAHDVIWSDHPCYVGRPGIMGDRAGNFVVQNSDLLIALGSRLSIRQVSYDWKNFARHAFKIMVDIDAAELKKPTLKIDLPIHADLGSFLKAVHAILDRAPSKSLPSWANWLQWGSQRRERYPVTLPEYWEQASPINPYCLIDAVTKALPADEVVVCGDGTACVVGFQAAFLRKGTRLYHNSGSAPMGYDLPAAIGACLGNKKKRVICITGDGSIQMNLQELQTIATHKLPIKIFLINNKGYHSIRQTQQNYFKESPVGYDAASGVEFPDFGKLAELYHIPFRTCNSLENLKGQIAETLDGVGPQFMEIMVQIDQPFAPKLSSRKLADGRMISSPLEDMSPFLSREEFRDNMIVPLLEE